MLGKFVVRILKKIVVNLPHRTIETDGRPYLTRWYLWPRGPRTKDMADDAVTPVAPIAVFVHFFHRGDDDRAQHSHPWSKSVSLILTGGYIEERGDMRRVMKPGRLNFIDKDDYHRVDLLKPEEGCWTLFIAGRNIGSWGFRDPETGEHVPWREYIGGENTVS